jgi:NAD(P)-dependent dehydrogenase (short-subunit alcohol dehydrogenase family)
LTENRVAVVTGANRGIGRELARQLVERGWSVVMGSRDAAKGRAAAAVSGSPGLAVPVQLDLGDPATIDVAAEEVRRRFGRADALVNNAATMYDTWARAVTADLDDVGRAFETNLFGAWRTALAFLPLLRHSRHGRIVNVSSEGGSISQMSGGTPAYSTSKAALNALTRLLGGELRADHILVNAVCPGWTATDMGKGGGRPVSAGAASVLWAVLLPDDGPTGGFFRDGRPLPW